MNPNGPNLVFLLNKSITLNQLKQIHAPIITNGLNELQSLLLRQVLHSNFTYSRTIAQYVHQILHNLQNPDDFSWGCAIRFFSLHFQYKTALSLYVQIKRLGLCPTSFAVSSALRACARIVHKVGGISIHAQIHKYGFCGCVYVQTALVDLYSKLGDMETARKVFDGMTEKNVVSWNSILSGYLKAGNMEEAQVVFDEIPNKDVVSWNSMVSGYARIGNMDKAFFLFQQMPERSSASWNAMISGFADCGRMESARSIFDSMPLRNKVSWIAMISGYSKCGNVESARQVFDQMSEKDVLSFNAMIACYAQNSQPKDALELFNQILKREVNIQPNEMTLASVISASSQLGDLKFGLWIETYMSKDGIELDDHLATALLDLYTKCGDIERAYKLFHGLKKRDVVAYSAMILGCGINGKAVDATKMFEEMVSAQICPNSVTYTGLLTAYNHAGLVEEGYRCFNSMNDHGVEPSGDHYGIMVDLLGRAGQFDKALELIRSMPMQPQAGVWGALLLACSLHNNVELGEIAARNCFKLEPDKSGYYALLANIYASAERWDDARRLRKVMEKKGFTKIPGCSWMQSI
ncbi:PREDICTED: pentatricopeptide repeat-containing [Prunus dulcis]|uniref:PREDICTED: pentatricopeptide repeat-containing n=1 Tax=Prunus dulcis TaxID=3755 RepID=A0A5E4F5Z0_PRUDU|nr:pentatricopeptide repeat-containing protein At4g22760 [Prunus dulcis]VVA23433.1 PREDICTED: pentatricopeptide repeat-containing [Prunus dulcis]